MNEKQCFNLKKKELLKDQEIGLFEFFKIINVLQINIST